MQQDRQFSCCGSSLPVSFYLLRFERVDNLGAYSIPSETGLLIPSVYGNYTSVAVYRGLTGTVPL